ncbi:hypothetical protein B0H13DRAFT_2328790 [Mycena leptocephala]|nr:hypothetical protein B0H13DRAFT_2328790 [Mycena leptocephala]
MPKPFVENYISFQLLAQKLMRTMYKADVVNHLQIKLTPPFLLPHGPFPRPMYATTRIFPPHSLSPHFPDAVFSREVPDIYLQYYASMGGRIATTPKEIKAALFFVCKDQSDVDFIAIWFNRTYRVVNRRFIADCKAAGKCMSEETYSWGG